jgi:hypothetical protein
VIFHLQAQAAGAGVEMASNPLCGIDPQVRTLREVTNFTTVRRPMLLAHAIFATHRLSFLTRFVSFTNLPAIPLLVMYVKSYA